MMSALKTCMFIMLKNQDLKIITLYSAAFILTCIIKCPDAAAQAGEAVSVTKNSLSGSKLFKDENVLQLQLSANFRSVQKDRDDDPAYHPALLSYKNDDSVQISIPIKIKARGNFRK